MPRLLTPEQYHHILPLYAPLDYNLVIRSVVEGNTPGWVFTERVTQPGVALIWNRQDALLLAGDNQDMAALASLRNLLHNHILPEARARWIPELALFYTPGWEYMLPALLSGLSARPARRFSYRYPAGAPTDQLPPPPGFTLQPMDESLLATDLDYLAQARGWIDSFWHSPEDFQRGGFGYCAVSEQQRLVASWCLTVYTAGRTTGPGPACELGVATAPDYRGLGLASLTTAACLRHALESGYEVHWHCWADNQPSVAIAKKLGFHLAQEYFVYRLATGFQPGE